MWVSMRRGQRLIVPRIRIGPVDGALEQQPRSLFSVLGIAPGRRDFQGKKLILELIFKIISHNLWSLNVQQSLSSTTLRCINKHA